MKKRALMAEDHIELRRVQKDLKHGLKESKDAYKRKLERNQTRGCVYEWDESNHWFPEERKVCS